MGMKWYISTRARLALALAAASLVSCGFFVVDALRDHTGKFYYLIWNLILAWIPLLLMLWLEKALRRKIWSSWETLGITALFVGFLPNTFYMTTDVMHIAEGPHIDLVFDIITFSSFIINAFMLGLISLFLFHTELRKRLTSRKSWAMLTVLILAVSFAIYIGRDLRWNTWDILLNPASVLFEVSDRLLAPVKHPELFTTTLGFFVFISSTYVVAYHVARAARSQKLPE